MAVSPPAPAAAPPRRKVTRRHPRPDRNRTLEILSVLVVYILGVHYALKAVSFFLPEDDVPSREEQLGIRGANGVLGLSLNAMSLPRRQPLSKGYSRTTTLHSVSEESLQEDTIVEDIAKEEEEVAYNKVKASGRPKKKKRERSRIPILSYKDNYVIVSKPTAMTMHHTSNTNWGRSKGDVLQTTIHKQLSRKPYLVHRLDHRTSGACILAFDSKTAGELHGRLRDDNAVKLYVALVRGDLRDRFQRAAMAPDDNGVDMSADGEGGIIGRHGSVPVIMNAEDEEQSSETCADDEHNGRITVNLPIKVIVNEVEIEKDAQTDFYFLASMDPDDEGNESDCNGSKTPYINKSLTLLLCHPRTGRTHQIRQHVRKAFSSPIISDSRHGDSRVNRYWRENVGLDRMGLHCWYLGLPSASDDHNSNIECIAPLPTDFTDALHHERLESLWQEAIRVQPQLNMEPYDERGGTFGRNYRKKGESDSNIGSNDEIDSKAKQHEWKPPAHSASFLQHLANVKASWPVQPDTEGVKCPGEPAIDPSRML